jgi:hypothetical protein
MTYISILLYAQNRQVTLSRSPSKTSSVIFDILEHRNYTEVDAFFRMSDRHLRRTTDLA